MHVTLNGETRQLDGGATVASLLAELKLDSRQVAVEVNEQLVPRGRHAQQALGDGDRLEVVTLVGGG